MTLILCPCCSGKPFSRCCAPYLKGTEKPRTVEKLMRSRYSAYALSGYGDYLYATWHPQTRVGISPEALSAPSVSWQSLDIRETQVQGNFGYVEFMARYLAEDGQLKDHHERSRFVRMKGQWLYLDGDVDTQRAS